MELERQQFTFYRSFLLTAEALPPKSRNEFLLSVIRYALDGTEPGKLSFAARSSFEAVRPILDKARRKALSGKTGGEASGEARSKPEANRSKPEANQSTGEPPAPVITGGNYTGDIYTNTFYQGGTEETGSNEDFPAPQERNKQYREVFSQLYFYEVPLTAKDKAEIKELCGQFGSQAVLDAIYTADKRNVRRWSYIRSIVTSGGVRQAGGQDRSHYIHHGEPLTPCMVDAARRMLEEPDDPGEDPAPQGLPDGAALAQADELLSEAVEVVLDAGAAQTSILQRRLQIGYGRAARLLDEMEERGFVGPLGAAPRKVLISREDWEAMKRDADPSLRSKLQHGGGDADCRGPLASR